jgi:drug/metabolite transporter (DMT)-like permease
MLSVIFGLSAALSLGTTDFLGGLASRRIGSLRTVWITLSTSLVFVSLGLIIVPGLWSVESVLFGGLSGLAYVLGLGFLFASLAIGPMSLLAPVGGVVGAMLPALWGFLSGERLSMLAYLAVALVLIAGVLVGFSFEKDTVKPRLRGVIFAVLAGVFFATYYVTLDLAPDDAGLTPLVANRTSSSLVATCAVVVISLYAMQKSKNIGRSGQVSSLDVNYSRLDWRKGLPIALAAGVFEALGTSFTMLGLAEGNLTIVAVLTSLYPAGTLVLATLILKERLGKVQYFGLALAVAASVTLALV